MKISVIILAWNEEKNIGKILKSIQEQTLMPEEVIVVNNNSTDRTVEIAKSFDFVRVINQSKIQGMIATRDYGFNNANNEILVKLDADTKLSSNWFEILKDTYEKNKDIKAVASMINYGIYSYPFVLLYIFTLYLFTGKIVFLGPAYSLKKEIWNKIKDEICKVDKVHEDIDIALNVGKYTKVKLIYNLMAKTSKRRMVLHPIKFFITDYPIRTYKTIKLFNQKN